MDLQAMERWLYWIPLLPFLGAATIGLLGHWLGKRAVSVIGCGAVLGSAVLAGYILLGMSLPALAGEGGAPPFLRDSLGTWFRAGSLTVDASFFVDHLGAILTMVVTGVSFLIHLYSTEYMREDAGYARYFAYLNLFVGFMLVLVLADNLVLMFVGWEGVGLCSYLLIGFWFDDDAKAYAGRKAFVVNRIGDFGFLLGLFTLFALFGTLQIYPVPQAADSRSLVELVGALGSGGLSTPVPSGVLAALGLTYGQAITLAALLLFVGATGKSAQMPLYVWLPDAMAGPTPVSALIHAATMVTAGVYMIARLSFLVALSPTAMFWMGLIGAFTALFAALMGLAQNDIKKVLAYSTVSQLGYMVMGVGLAAFWQGTYHLVTHAFFKACLFMGSGAVILGCHHEQDIRKMGGLRTRMPHTRWTFLIATITIAGVLPFSGFFSKDAILHAVHHTHLAGYPWIGTAAYWLGTAAAFCTAFYMFRLYFLVFSGAPRSHAAEHATERGWAVLLPLWVLALLSVAAAAWGWPWPPLATASAGGAHQPPFAAFTEPAFALGRGFFGGAESDEGLLGAFAVALGVGLAGWALAYVLYRLDGITRLAPLLQRGPGRAAYSLVANKFYVDEIYDALIVTPFKALAVLCWQVIDVFAIDTVAVAGTARLTAWVGSVLRYVQNGDVQRYAAVMAIAVVLALWAIL